MVLVDEAAVLVAATAATVVLVFAGSTFASPTPYPVTAGALDFEGLTHVSTAGSEVAVIIDAPSSEITRIGSFVYQPATRTGRTPRHAADTDVHHARSSPDGTDSTDTAVQDAQVRAGLQNR